MLFAETTACTLRTPSAPRHHPAGGYFGLRVYRVCRFSVLKIRAKHAKYVGFRLYRVFRFSVLIIRAKHAKPMLPGGLLLVRLAWLAVLFWETHAIIALAKFKGSYTRPIKKM